MIDIDFFKSINDRYGHIVGDEILKKFASFIDDQLEYDIVFGRFGGEEFSIFSRTDTGYNPYDYLNSLRTSVMDHIFDTSKGEVKITISVGYSLSMDNCEAIEEVIKRADKALYQAKRNGRNRTEGL
jgi:diguanylate cyclase (GGDEF)-like protein